LFPQELPSVDDRRILADVGASRPGPASGLHQWRHDMKEFNTEQAPHLIRTLDDVETDLVSGGKVKITGEAYIPFVGTFIWFDNGGLSYMGDDLLVINDYDLP
jgi:hypothetical protein